MSEENVQETARAANTFESKLQSQFNEEKWTRVSAKDVSISRFKLLEVLLDDAINDNKVEFLTEQAKEQLTEYESSIAARYFLGMIALKQDNPEEIVFLKQLLNQFEENSKWAVVDYLSDKMLADGENRAILRAKANALEKLGKNKELIPVLEKLTRVDRKNPDMLFKYADVVMVDDPDKAIQFYKLTAEAYAKNLQFEKLKTVWNKLVDLVPQDFTFYRKIERTLSGHRQKEVLADLFVQLAYHYIKEEDVDNIIQLSKKILDLNPNYTRFKNELVRSYRLKYKDHSLLEDFIKYSGLLDTRKKISNSILNFETNIVFDKENYVFHRVWGVGRIKDLNTEQMVIDFKDKPAHKMEIQMALKSLKPLQADHFWVHQYEDSDKMNKMFEEDFDNFFKILIKSFNNRISLADIKAELADQYIPLKTWSKWWTKKRVQILKSGNVRVSPQKKDIFEYHEASVSFSESSIEKFQNSPVFEEKMSVVFDALKAGDDAHEALEFMVSHFKETIKSFDFDTKLQSIWVLDWIHEEINDDEVYYTKDTSDKIVNEFKEMTIENASVLMPRLKNTELKKQYAKFIKDHHTDWAKIYIELLFQIPIKIHKVLMTDMVTDGANEAVLDFFARVRKESKQNAEIFLWSFKNLIINTWELPTIQLNEQILTFFRLLRSIPKIEQKGTKLKNIAKDLLLGSVQDEMIEVIKESSIDSVRKFASLFKDVPFFNDIEKQKVLQWLGEINPSAFEEDELAQRSGGAEAASLIEMVERDGQTIASQDAITKMKEELDHLISIEIPQNSEEIGLAQEKGDLRENAEYKAALERQSILQAQATKLENQIKEITPVYAHHITVEKIGLGTKVRLKDIDTNDIFVYSILDQWDADVDRGIISYKSPLGKTLLDCKIKDVVEFGSGEQVQKLEVLAVDSAINSDGVLV